MSDQNKGPIYGVDLPEFIQIPGSERVEVPRNRECYIDGLGESLWAALEASLALVAAIERGGYDVSPCLICQELTVCIPGGLAICRQCAEKAGREWYFEDDLPSDYDYQANFDRSRVIDGVRMFPAIPKAAE